MTFSQLRLNSPIYILHKDATPYVECGQVTNVSAPMPQLGNLPNMGQPLQYTVDVTVRVGESVSSYQRIPAHAEVADFAGNGNLFLSCSREGMNEEVQAMRQRSADVIASVDYHKGVIEVCDRMLQQLNPDAALKAQQQAEISDLKEKINSLMGMIAELKGEKSSSVESNV